jgi:hypothetical protein
MRDLFAAKEGAHIINVIAEKIVHVVSWDIKMKNFISLLIVCYHLDSLNQNYCPANRCHNLKVSWLGCRWPNLWYKPCRLLDANGREGRFYKNIGGIV